MPQQSNPEEATITDSHFSSTAQESTQPSGSLVGKTIGGRYLVEQELGRGGIGAVYLARDKPELMSRRVVVKVLLEDSLKDEWVIQKFQQEIESLTRLDDSGIVGIFDAGKLDDGAPYLVMQYVEGVNLRSEIKQGGMDLERAANIIRQVGTTLAAAHEAGIIHRDLKPENIMLRRTTSNAEQVKVIDFGIAKVKNSIVAPSTVTGAGVAGTIGYMPPEQLTAQRITPSSDIYALGVIAYEMLTGARPFNPETAFQLLEMQRAGVRVRPKDLRPVLSERAQEIILKALEFEPGERYQDVRELTESLARALTDDRAMLEAPTLKRPEQSEKIKEKAEEIKGKQRSSVPVLAAAAALLIIVVGALILWSPWKQKGADAKAADSKSNVAANVTTATAPRTLTYSLTIQKMVKDEKTGQYKEQGAPFASTGQEIYGNGWLFNLNLKPTESGSLYLLNEGPGANNSTVYHVLFPTPANNNGVAQLTAGQTVETRQYRFDEYTGTEKFWLIWSAQPLAELESIFKNAAQNGLVISDPAQIKTVRGVLARYDSSKTEVQSDKANKQTTIKGTGDVWLSLLELQHEQY